MKEAIIKETLRKFMYNDKLKYSQIWDKKICSSSHFDYYFKQLIEEGVVEKDGEYYKLTPKGEKEIFKVDGKSLENKEKPIVCAFVLGIDGDKILLTKRLKQPFYEYLNIPGGKVELGETTYDCARREFWEETALKSKPKLSQVVEKITYDEESGEVTHHMIGYFYKAYELEGELMEKSREGENVWITLEEFKKEKRFIEADELIPRIVNGNSVENIVIKRWKKNGEIIRYELTES